MKILMVAPYIGGIDVYVNSFVPKIKKMGHTVDVVGSVEGENSYNSETHSWKSYKEVVQIARNIYERINFSSYDIVAFHYGKNDIEMLIPTFIEKNKYPSTKFVYYVHYLSRNLFTQYIPNREIQDSIENAVFNFYDGYIFFGQWAKDFMEKQVGKTLRGAVAYLPETHSLEHGDNEEEIIDTLVADFNEIKNRVIFLPGFASNYKDHELLLNSFRLVRNKLVYYFAGPGWRKRIPTDLKIGNVEVRVIDKYLNPLEYKILTKNSIFGIFPYRQPEVKGEYFQGSGTIPNFIYYGKASVALNEGTIPEMIGDSGIIVKDRDCVALADAIDRLSDPLTRKKFEDHAKKRSYLFSTDYHAERSISFFKDILSSN